MEQWQYKLPSLFLFIYLSYLLPYNCNDPLCPFTTHPQDTIRQLFNNSSQGIYPSIIQQRRGQIFIAAIEDTNVGLHYVCGVIGILTGF